MRTTTVYLLHFERPISSGHTAQHYIGSCSNLVDRLVMHLEGRGSRLCQVAIERGISWRLARIWPGDRMTERTLKNKKNAPRLCPLCQERLGNQAGLFDQDIDFYGEVAR